MEYKGKEIVVLKQVPRRVREKKREYQFLTTTLLKKGVKYRWLIPEGLIFSWKGQRYRIDTIEKAEAFYTDHLRGKAEKTGKEELMVQLLDIPTTETEKLESAVGGIVIEEGVVGGVDFREQWEPRSTRAINPTYKI